MSDWRSSVYHERTFEKLDISGVAWKEIRRWIIKRDRRCYRCETRQQRNLTVHHIIPRSEGGEENAENLVTLCIDCHNIVEIAGCRSLADILSTIEKEEEPVPPKELKQLDREENFERPEWHKWVYGGERRPT